MGYSVADPVSVRGRANHDGEKSRWLDYFASCDTVGNRNRLEVRAPASGYHLALESEMNVRNRGDLFNQILRHALFELFGPHHKCHTASEARQIYSRLTS